MRGKFIVFEGIDGCGKTTQLKRIRDWLPISGLISPNTRIVATREPGFIPGLRGILRDPSQKLNARAELLLLLADRVQHVSQLIEPALEKGGLGPM